MYTNNCRSCAHVWKTKEKETVCPRCHAKGTFISHTFNPKQSIGLSIKKKDK